MFIKLKQQSLRIDVSTPFQSVTIITSIHDYNYITKSKVKRSEKNQWKYKWVILHVFWCLLMLPSLVSVVRCLLPSNSDLWSLVPPSFQTFPGCELICWEFTWFPLRSLHQYIEFFCKCYLLSDRIIYNLWVFSFFVS